MGPWGRGFGALVLLATLGVASTAQAQSEEQRVAARAAADAGSESMKAGKYEEAAQYFERAEAILPVPTLSLRLARARVKLGRYVQAREAYLRAINATVAPDAPRALHDAQADAAKELPGVKAKIANITVTVQGAKPEEVEVTIDGRAVLSSVLGVPYPVDPGHHVVKLSGQGYLPAMRTVDLAAGGASSVPLIAAPDPNAKPPEPEPAADAQSGAEPAVSNASTTGSAPVDRGSSGGTSAWTIGGIIGLGLGAVGAVAGTVFIVQYVNEQNRASEIYTCNLTVCSMEQQAQVRSHEAAAREAAAFATVSYIAGGVMLGLGITGVAIGASSNESALTLAPYFVGTGGGIVGRF